MRDHYRVLNLRHTATVEEVHTAYRSLARRFHPDRNPDPEAAAQMIQINEAYSWLGDPSRRSAYDQKFVAAEPPELQTAVLDAAREQLRTAGGRWCDTGVGDPIIDTGSGRVAVRLTGLLGHVELEEWTRELDPLLTRNVADSAVCMAYRVFVADRMGSLESSSHPLIVIDLLQARSHGADFPTPEVRQLFEPFLLD